MKNADNANMVEIGPDGAHHLSNKAKLQDLVNYLQDQNCIIKSLDCSNLSLTTDELKLLCGALKANTTVTRLNLSYNNIQYEGAEVISDMLRENTTLTGLILNDNRIKDKGVGLICDVLKSSNSSLKSLHIKSNGIGDEGASELAAMLKSNKVITDLNLDINFITDIGANELADAIKINDSLTFFGIARSGIRTEGASNLVEAIKHSKMLLSVNLEGLPIQYMDERMLDFKLRQRQSAFNDMVNDLSGGGDITKPLSVTQYKQLQLVGDDYYDRNQSQAKLSFFNFEIKWHDVLDKQYYNYALILAKSFVSSNASLACFPAMLATAHNLFFPPEISERIASMILPKDKLESMDKAFNERKAEKESKGDDNPSFYY